MELEPKIRGKKTKAIRVEESSLTWIIARGAESF